MAKGLRELHIPWTTQPDGEPDVDWNNPITKNLRGLLWTGPHGSRELVGRSQWPVDRGVVRAPTRHGVGSYIANALDNSINGIRADQITPTIDWRQNWMINTLPLSLMQFAEIGTHASSSAIGGVSGNNQLQYGLMINYGTRTRGCAVNNGVFGGRIFVDGSSHYTIPGDTQWSTGFTVKGFVATPSEMLLYDEGLLKAYLASGHSLPMLYDATYAQPYFIRGNMSGGTDGTGFWQAVWDRALSAEESMSLHQSPWQLFKPKRILLPPYAPIGVPTLTDAQVTALAETTARPRVTLTF